MNKILKRTFIATFIFAFACHAEESINLKQPVEIKEHLYYSDGGTTCVILKDKYSNETAFCFDGRGGELNNRLFYGARHPSFKGAKLVKIGSTIEKTVLSLIHGAINSVCDQNRQKELLEKQTAMGLKLEELDIWHLLRVLQRYEEKIKSFNK